MSRTFVAALACVILTGLFVLLAWPSQDVRRPNAPVYSSTTYDPR